MKVYEKPRITIEQFTLSQHVADCGWELQAGNEGQLHCESRSGMEPWSAGRNKNVFRWSL